MKSFKEFRKWNKAASTHWRIERKQGNLWGKKRFRWPGYAMPFAGAALAAHGAINKDPTAIAGGLATMGLMNLGTKKLTKQADGIKDGWRKEVGALEPSDIPKVVAISAFPPLLARAILKPHIDDIKEIKKRLDDIENR